MAGASSLPTRFEGHPFQYAAKFRQTVLFHFLAVALIASNGLVGAFMGYGGEAIACSITLILLTLNLLHALFRPRSYFSFAAVGLGLAVIHLAVVGALMPELPIVLGYFVFSPILAVVLIGEQHIKRWSYFTIAAVLLMVGLSQTGLANLWRGHMSAPQLFFVTLLTLASMMTLATMTIFVLLEDHREFASKMTYQQQWLEAMNRRLVLLQTSKER